jgi:ATP/maltotriose-dependent transcriptional regulator MalT
MATGHNGASDILTKYWPLVAGFAMAGWALFREWASGRRRRSRETAAALSQRGALITIAQDAAKGVIQILTDENRRLSARVDEIEDEMKRLQAETTLSLRTKDSEIMLLRGDLRQALSFVSAYDKLLSEHAIEHQQPSKPFWVLADGHVASVETGDGI